MTNTPVPPSHRYDVIVIGVGAMGSAMTYELARHGLRVLCLERFDIPHDYGSSHGYTRIIRPTYDENPTYVPLVRRAMTSVCSGSTASIRTVKSVPQPTRFMREAAHD